MALSTRPITPFGEIRLGRRPTWRADGDDNGTIEQADYDFWRARFGNVAQGGEIIMTGSSTLKANGEH